MVEINPFEIVMQVINFGILLWLLSRFLFKPLSAFLEKRSAEIKNNLESADAAKLASEKQYEEAKKELENAKIEAKKTISHALSTGNHEKKKIIESAEIKVKEMLEFGKREVDGNIKKAKQELKNQIADISVDIATTILEREVTKKDHERIVKDHLYEISEIK